MTTPNERIQAIITGLDNFAVAIGGGHMRGSEHQRILESIASSVTAMVVQRDGTIAYATEPLETLFGYLPGGLEGKHYSTLIPDDMRAEHDSHYQSFWTNPTRRAMGQGPANLKGRRKDGSTFAVAVGLAPCEIAGREVVVVTVLAQSGKADGE